MYSNDIEILDSGKVRLGYMEISLQELQYIVFVYLKYHLNGPLLDQVLYI